MNMLITSPAFCKPNMADAVNYAESLFDSVIVNPYGRTMNTQEILDHIDGVNGILAGLEEYSLDVIGQLPKSVSVISRYGVGYDAVDLHAAVDAGIAVTNTPGANASTVADHTLAMILALLRNIPQINRQVKAGEWLPFAGSELEGKILGILGLGNIGKKVARRAASFGVKVQAYDPAFDDDFAKEHCIDFADFDHLVASSDIITLHTSVNEKTYHMVNSEFLSMMKSSAVLVNIARGVLIDEEALYEALESDRINGAALDVFEGEPPVGNPLLTLDNVIATSHIGGASIEADKRMGKMSVDNAYALLNGQKCSYIVNRNLEK